jgi:hypothetical protein
MVGNVTGGGGKKELWFQDVGQSEKLPAGEGSEERDPNKGWQLPVPALTASGLVIARSAER